MSARRKSSRPRCPAPDCSGGYTGRLRQVAPESIPIPEEVQQRAGKGDVIYRCGYCGFVWAQKSSSQPGVNVTPLGFYRNFSNPNEFFPVSEDYEIRK